MSEFRFITSSDEHLCDHVGFRKDSYRNSILKKLEWQGEFARKFNADAILRGGDFFHVKAANKTTMATVAAASLVHRRYPCLTYALIGNHDLGHGHDLEAIERQPLGVMFNSGVLRRLTDEDFICDSSKIRVVGVDYTTDLGHDGLCDLVRKKDENYTIAVVHALAAYAPEEKIQSFFGEKIFDYRDLVFDGCPDVYVFGHYHKDQGVQEHLGVKFVNVGAVSRGALTFENLERTPKISSILINSQGISIEEHVIPHEDSSQVFDLEKKQQLDKEKKSLDDFITKLRSDIDTGSSNLEKYREDMRTSGYPQDLKNLIEEVLEAAKNGDV